MDSFKAVIARFGSVERFAEAIGVKVTTAYSWHQRDSIPHERCRRVVSVAQDRGLADITFSLLAGLAEKRAVEGPAKSLRQRRADAAEEASA